MIVFSLNTFVKICLLDTGGRISEIQKRLNGSGGYDFYKPLQNAVRAHSSGRHVKASQILAAPSNEIERKRNNLAFAAFDARFGALRSIQSVKSPKKLDFPNSGISILVDPLFEISKSGIRQVYSLWPTQSPPLTQKYGAVACQIMREAYSKTGLANASFLFSDIVSNRIYSEKQITNNTKLILMADVNSISTLVKEL